MSLVTILEIYGICATIGIVFLSFKLGSAKVETIPSDGLLDRLLPLLIQYKTLQRIIEVNPYLPALELIPLLAVLDSVANYCHLEPIGEVWQQVEFNPQYHQPDNAQIQPGQLVYVRYIGYRTGNKIHVPAKVSLHLPPHALRSE